MNVVQGLEIGLYVGKVVIPSCWCYRRCHLSVLPSTSGGREVMAVREKESWTDAATGLSRYHHLVSFVHGVIMFSRYVARSTLVIGMRARGDRN